LNDTTEVIVGNKVITITIDSITGKKDVQVTTRADGDGDEDGDDDDDDEKTIRPVDVGVLNVDLGANWLMYNNSLNLPSTQSNFETIPLRSTNLALHVLPTHFNMFKGHVSFLTAITFDNNKYQFRNNVSMVPGQPSVTMLKDSVGFKKNKLNTWYAQIPLMLCFQTNPTNPKKNFHISLGGFAGLFLAANTKQKSEERGKVVLKDDFNLNPMRYGVTARIGYGNLELYSTYTLSPVFREGQGPSFNNINFGIALTGMM
jgi:Outer membrane protein beta-barrel domain